MVILVAVVIVLLIALVQEEKTRLQNIEKELNKNIEMERVKNKQTLDQTLHWRLQSVKRELRETKDTLDKVRDQLKIYKCENEILTDTHAFFIGKYHA